MGEVKHFSYWNCDYPFDAVNLSLTLQTPDGAPMIYSNVKISAMDSGRYASAAYGYTDSLGQAQGLVPANANLKLDVLGPCGTIIYTQTIPAISESKDLGIIKITDAGSYLLTYTGTLLNCNNQPVTHGYVTINYDYSTRYIATDKDGKFTTTYISCSNPLTTSQVLGIDQDTQQQGLATTVAVTSPLTNAGTIIACGTSSEQYINYTLDGTDYSILSSANDSLTAYVTVNIGRNTIYGFSHSNPNNALNFEVTADATGTFPVNYMAVQNNDSTTLVQPFNVTFTNFPTQAGEFYEGSLSGKFKDQSSILHNLTSTFKVRRNN